MSPSDPTDHELATQLIAEEPLLVWFFGLLALGFLLSWAYLIIFRRRILAHAPQGVSWAMSWTDFGLFMALVTLAAFNGSVCSSLLTRQFFGEPAAFPLQATVFGGLTMQLGLILVYFIFRRIYPLSPPPLVLERPRPSLARAVCLSLVLCLAAVPFFFLIGALWSWLMPLINELLGTDIQLNAQPYILMLRQAQSPFWLGLLVIVAVVGAPLAEELVFRGGIYRFFRQRFPITGAAFVSALLFALVHSNLAGMATLVVIGMTLCLAYELSGDLRTSIFLHACYNGIVITMILLLPEELLAL